MWPGTAPGATASVLLDLVSDPGRLTVRNQLPEDAVRSAGGSGLTGMAQRVDPASSALSSSK